MSFGFSPNDIIGLITLTSRTYKGWRDACSDYADITGTLDCLYLLLKRLETHVPTDPTSEPRFAREEALRRDLATVIRGVRRTVDELERLLDQFPTLSGSRSKNWERIRFGAKDLTGLRNRLTQHVSSISAFLNVVELESIGRLDQNVNAMPDLITERVTIALGNFIDAREADSKSAKGETVLTSYSNDDVEVWRQFRSECVKSGIKSDELKKFEPELRRFIQSIIDGKPTSDAKDSHIHNNDHRVYGDRAKSSPDKQQSPSISSEATNDRPSQDSAHIRERDGYCNPSAAETLHSESLPAEHLCTASKEALGSSQIGNTFKGTDSTSAGHHDSPHAKDQAGDIVSIGPREKSQQSRHGTKKQAAEVPQQQHGSSATTNQSTNVVRRKPNFSDDALPTRSKQSTVNYREQDLVEGLSTATEYPISSKAIELDHEDVLELESERLADPDIVRRIGRKDRGDRSKNKSRVEQVVSPPRTGLEGAALAGLYERNMMSRKSSMEQTVQQGQDPFRRHRSGVLRPSNRPSGEDLLKKFHSLQEMKDVPRGHTSENLRNDDLPRKTSSSLSLRPSSSLSRKGSSTLSRKASTNTVNVSRSTTPIQQHINVKDKPFDDTGSTLRLKSLESSRTDNHVSSRGNLTIPPIPGPPDRPAADMNDRAWCEYAGAFGDYIRAFTAYESMLLRRFEFSNNRARKHSSNGKSMDKEWLERMCDAKGMPVALVGWLTYAERVEKDEEVREVWKAAWKRHSEAVRTFMSLSRSVMAAGRQDDEKQDGLEQQ